jgi:DNA-binding response OmpR family regulator
MIMISASEEANVRGLALAGADYLLKPISPEWLRQAIRLSMGRTSPSSCT